MMYTDCECLGAIVRSLKGRDRHRVFMITGACSDGSSCVLVADGVLHPLSKPKKKNLCHLAVLAAAGEDQTSHLSSDSALKSFLKAFEDGIGTGKE